MSSGEGQLSKRSHISFGLPSPAVEPAEDLLRCFVVCDRASVELTKEDLVDEDARLVSEVCEA